METFAKLFERFLVFIYHCFDRIVIQGYLPLLTRPEHVVHFFRDVHGLYPITPEVLAKRTSQYRGWVEGYIRNHKIPVMKAEKGVSKEACVRPHLRRMERRNQHGVYFVFTSMEMGSTFRSQMPRFPTDDPNYRIIRRCPSRFLHYYFYIRDPVIGPLSMCVSTYLPFQTTYYLNGHNFIEIELRRQGVAFRKDDNAFLSTSDPKALQSAADKLSASLIEKRLNYWSWLLGPKFSEKDRKAVNLKRAYSINQAEYCRNFIFKRHFPIHRIFERSCWPRARGHGSLIRGQGGPWPSPQGQVCSVWPPTEWLSSSAYASRNDCEASCTAFWKSSTMGITCCGSTARTWWAACTRSSALS